ncbi:hypothetical protein HKD37_08G022582 [Glycine soja]
MRGGIAPSSCSCRISPLGKWMSTPMSNVCGGGFKIQKLEFGDDDSEESLGGSHGLEDKRGFGERMGREEWRT